MAGEWRLEDEFDLEAPAGTIAPVYSGAFAARLKSRPVTKHKELTGDILVQLRELTRPLRIAVRSHIGDRRIEAIRAGPRSWVYRWEREDNRKPSFRFRGWILEHEPPVCFGLLRK